MSIKYKEYIKSKEWKKRRKKIFEKRGRECEQCGFGYYLHVHHKTYDNLGNEKDDDLQILCYRCHMSKHEKYFKKYVLKKKKLKKRRVKRKLKKPRTPLLERDFSTLKVGEKRKYLRLKGYKLN